MIHHKKLVSHTMVHEKLIQFYKGKLCTLHCLLYLLNQSLIISYLITGFKSDAHPMAIMTGVVGALSAFYHDR